MTLARADDAAPLLAMNAALRAAFESLVAAGDTALYYVRADKLVRLGSGRGELEKGGSRLWCKGNTGVRL